MKRGGTGPKRLRNISPASKIRIGNAGNYETSAQTPGRASRSAYAEIYLTGPEAKYYLRTWGALKNPGIRFQLWNTRPEDQGGPQLVNEGILTDGRADFNSLVNPNPETTIPSFGPYVLKLWGANATKLLMMESSLVMEDNFLRLNDLMPESPPPLSFRRRQSGNGDKPKTSEGF